MKADTELAVAEIENLNQVSTDSESNLEKAPNLNLSNDDQTTILSSSECAVPLVDSQKLLVDLATKIVDSASVIEVGNIWRKKKTFHFK